MTTPPTTSLLASRSSSSAGKMTPLSYDSIPSSSSPNKIVTIVTEEASRPRIPLGFRSGLHTLRRRVDPSAKFFQVWTGSLAETLDEPPPDLRQALAKHPGRRWFILHHPDKSFRALNLEEGIPIEARKRSFLLLLVVLAVLADGIRPIALVWSKGGEAKPFPFMFPTWLVLVKFLVLIFSLLGMKLAQHMSRGGIPRSSSTTSRAVDDDDDEEEEKQTHPKTLTFREKCWLSLYLLPSVIFYTASDLLAFPIFEYGVSPTTYSCVKQTRIVMTALLFRFVLRRPLSNLQWLSTIQLTLAAVLFVAQDHRSASSSSSSSDDLQDLISPSLLTGLLLLLFKCFLDSVSVIWIDSFFKKFDAENVGFPYSEQQVAYSLWSLVVGLIFFLVYDAKEILQENRGFFDGYNTGAYVSAVLTAFYGILVSLVLRYMDSMTKMFQALSSIVITYLCDPYGGGRTHGGGLERLVAIAFIVSSVFLYSSGKMANKEEE